MGLPAQRELLYTAADYILNQSYTPNLDDPDNTLPTVSNYQIAQFLNRYPNYKVVQQKTLDLKRKQVEGYKALKEQFRKYKDIYKKHGIFNKDIQNIDKIGFYIGVRYNQLVIIKQRRQLYLGVPTN